MGFGCDSKCFSDFFQHYFWNGLIWMNAIRLLWWWVNTDLSNKQLGAWHSTMKYGIIISQWFKGCLYRKEMPCARKANHTQNFWKHLYLKHFLSKCPQMNAIHWWQVKIDSGIKPLIQALCHYQNQCWSSSMTTPKANELKKRLLVTPRHLQGNVPRKLLSGLVSCPGEADISWEGRESITIT